MSLTRLCLFVATLVFAAACNDSATTDFESASGSGSEDGSSSGTGTSDDGYLALEDAKNFVRGFKAASDVTQADYIDSGILETAELELEQAADFYNHAGERLAETLTIAAVVAAEAALQSYDANSQEFEMDSKTWDLAFAQSLFDEAGFGVSFSGVLHDAIVTGDELAGTLDFTVTMDHATGILTTASGQVLLPNFSSASDLYRLELTDLTVTDSVSETNAAKVAFDLGKAYATVDFFHELDLGTLADEGSTDVILEEAKSIAVGVQDLTVSYLNFEKGNVTFGGGFGFKLASNQASYDEGLSFERALLPVKVQFAGNFQFGNLAFEGGFDIAASNAADALWIDAVIDNRISASINEYFSLEFNSGDDFSGDQTDAVLTVTLGDQHDWWTPNNSNMLEFRLVDQNGSLGSCTNVNGANYLFEREWVGSDESFIDTTNLPNGDCVSSWDDLGFVWNSFALDFTSTVPAVVHGIEYDFIFLSDVIIDSVNYDVMPAVVDWRHYSWVDSVKALNADHSCGTEGHHLGFYEQCVANSADDFKWQFSSFVRAGSVDGTTSDVALRFTIEDEEHRSFSSWISFLSEIEYYSYDTAALPGELLLEHGENSWRLSFVSCSYWHETCEPSLTISNVSTNPDTNGTIRMTLLLEEYDDVGNLTLNGETVASVKQESRDLYVLFNDGTRIDLMTR